jgi:molybdopterin converting factor small subunit
MVSMRVKVQLMGIYRGTGGKREMVLEVPNNTTIGMAIKQLIEDNSELKSVIWDNEVDSPSPNALIMLDGVEISNLIGVETPLRPEQEIILLSVVHGG